MTQLKTDVTLNEAVEIVAILQEAAANEHRNITVLDVGGGEKPLVFATHILDILDYEHRADNGYIPEEASAGACRFTADSWTRGDVCITPWKWPAKYFDVVWCTDTLAMLRDPVSVVKEMTRVGKSGYIRIPHKNYESLLGVETDAYAGYGLNRWFIQLLATADKMQPCMLFTYKHPSIHDITYTPEPSGDKYIGIWWTGVLDAIEVMYKSNDEYESLILDWRFDNAS